MRPDFEARIAAIAGDRESGASEILEAVLAILRDAIAAREDLHPVAAALREAQPSMAPVWNATKAALAAAADPQALDRFALRASRAPDAMARFAAGVLGLGLAPHTRLRLVTCSYSRSVLRILERLAGERPLAVACAEGRPACEGRRMADQLAAAGIPVTFYTDAAIGEALTGAHELLVGADAVTPAWFMNKAGTRLLAAAAAERGTGMYVAASLDKFVDQRTGDAFTLREGAPAEVWDPVRQGVTVRNPYFERVPLSLSAAIICEAGVIPPSEVINMSV